MLSKHSNRQSPEFPGKPENPETAVETLLNRTNAYGDGYFGRPIKACPVDPSKNHGVSRFPALPMSPPGPDGVNPLDDRVWQNNDTDVQTRDCASL